MKKELAKYQHQSSAQQHPAHLAHMIYVGPTKVAQAQVLPQEAPVIPASVVVSNMLKAGAQGSHLPRWGDKDCSCHEGLRLYTQGKYVEAAAAYHKAGETMLKAWGHPTCDVANAWRGEAVCMAAAGRPQDAKQLFRRAAEIYLSAGSTVKEEQLESTLNDLGETCTRTGSAALAQVLNSCRPRICALARKDPAEAMIEFHRIANN
jgi:tetratricopeptide (TPR) repeat protein